MARIVVLVRSGTILIVGILWYESCLDLSLWIIEREKVIDKSGSGSAGVWGSIFNDNSGER